MFQAGRIDYDPLFGKPIELYRYNGLVSSIPGQSDTDWVTQKTFTYDTNGRLITETDALGNSTTYTYDGLDRKTLITKPDATTTQFTYDDRTVIITDANGNLKTQTYDLLDRLVSVTESPSPGTTYTTTYTYDSYYDNSGDKPVYHLISVTNPLGAVTTYTYNNLGQLIQTDYPQDGTNPMTAETFTYDNVGNLLTKTNGKGTKRLTYEYFSGYRVSEVTEPDGRMVSYTYDANDNPLTQSWDGGSYTYTYDARNQVKTMTAVLDGYTFQFGYDYDVYGRVTEVTYPNRSNSVTYTYDTLDRLQTILGFVSSCSYDLSNKLLEMVYSNGIANTYTYDVNSRPTNISAGGGSLLDLNYTYDNVGNIMQINSDYYGYDGLNRLTWFGNLPYAQKTSGSGTVWSYDGAGNMSSKETYLNGVSQGVTSFSYDLANRLESMGTTLYVNDNTGSRTEKTNSKETWTYLYDGESRLTQVNKSGVVQVECAYDGAGMRYKKVENGKTTYYVTVALIRLWNIPQMMGVTCIGSMPGRKRLPKKKTVW